jgi:hypothetical protein
MGLPLRQARLRTCGTGPTPVEEAAMPKVTEKTIEALKLVD